MDIEWGEYEILDYLIKNDAFSFKKWYIEFHYPKEDGNNQNIFLNFVSYLHQNWYKIKFEDTTWKRIEFNNIENFTFPIFVIYFNKRD